MKPNISCLSFGGRLPKLKFSTKLAGCGLLFVALSFPSMAQQNVYGCPGQPSSSVFYARIDSLPVLAQSAAYTTNMGTATLSWDSGLGVTLSNSSAPTINAQFAYTPGYNGTWRYPAYQSVNREGGSLGGAYGGDHHTVVVDSDTCTIWETYHAYVDPASGAIEKGHTCSGKPCNAQSGWKYDGVNEALPTQGTTDAAGLPILPLLWRGHEILDGALRHPVRFTMARGYIQAGHPQWPAVGTNGWGGVNTPPYGTRFRLKATAKINLGGLTASQQVYANTIITALQRYGLVLADIGSNMNASVDDEAGQNGDTMAALNAVGSQIRPAQLEAVNLASLKPTLPTYSVARPTSSVPSVMVGTPYPTFLSVQAGTSMQLQSWVNGPAGSGDVIWDLAGDIGTVTANGLYTPPANVNGIVKGLLTVTALADPTAISTVYVRVLPAGPIRIAAGLRSGTLTDKLGQSWLPNIFFRGGDTVYHASDYPNWPVPSDPTQAAQLNIYQTTSYTYGNDQSFKLVVPNGTYSVRLMFGQPYNGQKPSACSPFPAQWHNYIGVEVQNAMVVKNFDFGASINHACAVPVDLKLPATVTNNTLELALRNTVPDGQTTGVAPQLSGIEIIRVK